MGMGKKNDQIADNAAICNGKLANSYTSTEITNFSRDQLNGETIPTGTIVHNSTLDRLQVYDGAAWQDVQVHRIILQAGVDVQIPDGETGVVYGLGIAPCDGTVVGVQAIASAVADTAAIAIQNLDLAGGAGDICSSFPAITAATAGTVKDGTLHGTAANLVVNKDDRFQMKVTTSGGSSSIDDMTVVIDIAESI